MPLLCTVLLTVKPFIQSKSRAVLVPLASSR
jgi:hypothetical protein